MQVRFAGAVGTRISPLRLSGGMRPRDAIRNWVQFVRGNGMRRPCTHATREHRAGGGGGKALVAVKIAGTRDVYPAINRMGGDISDVG